MARRPGLLDADGPLPWQLVRAIPAIRRDPLAYLEDAVGQFGDLVSFPLPRTPVLLVNDPASVRRVLQENHRGYGKQTVQYSSLAMVTGSGLIVADGPQWKRRRRLVQPAFHHGELEGVARQSVAAAAALAADWSGRPDQVVDVDVATVLLSLRIVGRTLFDDDLAASGEHLVAAVARALEAVVARARSPLPVTLLRSRVRLRRAVRTIDRTSADVIARRRARGIEQGNDLLAMLLRASSDPDGPDGPDAADRLDDGGIRDELVSLVIAGHETVASSLTWALWLLADDRARGGSTQTRLQAELDAVLAERPDGPQWADLASLSFTRAVMDEALRLYPPVWLITRRALADDTIGGISVPAGTLVIMSPWLLHRRPQAWSRPGRFDPDRFAGDLARAAARSADYLPFGSGPRLCLGRDFALVETVLVLATLLRRHTVLPVAADDAPQVEAAVTLRPRERLRLRLVPR